MAQDNLQDSNNRGPQGNYQPKYPETRPLRHEEMDYNLDLIGQVIKGYRVMGSGPAGELDLSTDVEKVLKLYKVTNSDTNLITSGAQVDDYVWVPIEITDGINTNNTYLHIQGSLSDEWLINHNLNKLPSVTIMDTSNRVVAADIEYIDNNNLKITFNNPFKGRATLN